MWLRLLTATRIHAVMVSATATNTTSCDRQTKRRLRFVSPRLASCRFRPGSLWPTRATWTRANLLAWLTCHMPVMSLRSQHNKLQQRAAAEGERSYLPRQQHLSIWPLWWQGETRSEAACGARCTLIGTKLCVKPTQAEPTIKAETKSAWPRFVSSPYQSLSLIPLVDVAVAAPAPAEPVAVVSFAVNLCAESNPLARKSNGCRRSNHCNRGTQRGNRTLLHFVQQWKTSLCCKEKHATFTHTKLLPVIKIEMQLRLNT